MNPKLTIGLSIGGVVLLTFGIMTGASYNTLVDKKVDIDVAKGTIVTSMATRENLSASLLTAADLYLDHESDIYTMITDARADYATAASGGDLAELIAADNLNSVALTNLLAIMESNPEIQGDNIVLGYMQTLENLEYTLQTARDIYNDFVGEYNKTAQKFPTILFTRMFGYPLEYPIWSTPNINPIG